MENFLTPEKCSNTPNKLMKIVTHVYTPNKKLLDGTSKGTDSPFNILGNHSTPPSRFFKVRNPFDAALANRLHLPISSPMFYKKESTPKKVNKFRWSIEDIALLNPAPIEEHYCKQFDVPEDPEIEKTAHTNIEKYFNGTHEIVPSPLEKPKAQSLYIPKELDSTASPETRDGVCQTILTLPPKLPEDVEKVLSSYFSYTQDQQQVHEDDGVEGMSTSLIRRLFHFSNESIVETVANRDELPPYESPNMLNHSLEQTSFSHSMMESSLISPIRNESPVNNSNKLKLIHQSTPTPSPQSIKSSPVLELQDSPLSPISKAGSTPTDIHEKCDLSGDAIENQTIENRSINSSRRSIKRLNFLNEMSVDIVPDTENLPEQSISVMSTSGLLIEEDCTYSSVNWDIEKCVISNQLATKVIDHGDIKSDNLIKTCSFLNNPKNTSLMDISCLNMSNQSIQIKRRQRLRTLNRKYSGNFDEHDKENIPLEAIRRGSLRRCFSDSAKTCNTSVKRQFMADGSYRTRQPSFTSTIDTSISVDTTDLIPDRSISDVTESGSRKFDDCPDFDTGYNSNLSVTNMFTSTNIAGDITSESNIKNWQTNYFSSTSTPSKLYK